MASETGGTKPQYDLPVDSEQKATRINLLSFSRPHMRALHLSWITHFIGFTSTFAPAALVTVIRDDIGLTRTDVGNAGVAAVCGAIFARIAMGNFIDAYGPRYGISLMCLMVAPAVFCTALVENAAGFIIVRFVIGLALATFVGGQFWSSCMFNVKIVGTANSLAAGWGNVGGGACQIIMPNLYMAIAASTGPFTAWRWAFFLPGCLQLVGGMSVMLFGQDLPTGNYKNLHRSGSMAQAKGWGGVLAAVRNYRTWVMTLLYGYCFGVELSVQNIITPYFADQFGIDVTTAGNIACLFGFMNIFARLIGGLASDKASEIFGMRGRLWCYWLAQSLCGVFCCLMAIVDSSLMGTIAVMVVFAIFAQAASGMSLGIVPFISKRSLGLVMGLVGAGGNAGAAVLQGIFFSGTSEMSTQQGLIGMGLMSIGITLLMFVMYFPMWGGMLMRAKEEVTEEDYYFAEYTAEERAAGMHTPSIRFAMESKSQRGSRTAGGSQRGLVVSGVAARA